MSDCKPETFELATLGHIRGHGCRQLLVRCNAIGCDHSATVNADHWPDETAIRSIGALSVCSRCGHVGADVRPDWSAHTNPVNGLTDDAVGSGQVPKRSVTIAGRNTSITLEDEFWNGLREIAIQRHMSLSDLVSVINSERQHRNLSSAVRVFVLDFYRNRVNR